MRVGAIEQQEPAPQIAITAQSIEQKTKGSQVGHQDTHLAGWQTGIAEAWKSR